MLQQETAKLVRLFDKREKKNVLRGMATLARQPWQGNPGPTSAVRCFC
jgi:hypothetical protein